MLVTRMASSPGERHPQPDQRTVLAKREHLVVGPEPRRRDHRNNRVNPFGDKAMGAVKDKRSRTDRGLAPWSTSAAGDVGIASGVDGDVARARAGREQPAVAGERVELVGVAVEIHDRPGLL